MTGADRNRRAKPTISLSVVFRVFQRCPRFLQRHLGKGASVAHRMRKSGANVSSPSSTARPSAIRRLIFSARPRRTSFPCDNMPPSRLKGRGIACVGRRDRFTASPVGDGRAGVERFPYSACPGPSFFSRWRSSGPSALRSFPRPGSILAALAGDGALTAQTRRGPALSAGSAAAP